MNFLNRAKKHSVCNECRVHFEPEAGARHPELCPTHRKPVVEIEDRILLVCEWAKANWKTLEPDARKWNEERNTIYRGMLNALGNSALVQQQASAQAAATNNQWSGIGGAIGGFK